MKMEWYVGRSLGNHKLIAFTSNVEPTDKTHGNLFNYSIGPFKTKRAALWAELYGNGNPHFRHIYDAERLSKKD